MCLGLAWRLWFWHMLVIIKYFPSKKKWWWWRWLMMMIANTEKITICAWCCCKWLQLFITETKKKLLTLMTHINDQYSKGLVDDDNVDSNVTLMNSATVIFLVKIGLTNPKFILISSKHAWQNQITSIILLKIFGGVMHRV